MYAHAFVQQPSPTRRLHLHNEYYSLIKKKKIGNNCGKIVTNSKTERLCIEEPSCILIQ